MAAHEMNNVVLLPQTVDYYQVELTRMLEAESYAEAIELLDFLLRCHSVDGPTDQEWLNLLQWLKKMFPEHSLPVDIGEEEEEETELDLYRQNFKHRTQSDQHLTEKLLDVLRQKTSSDKQIIALEQLTYIEHPEINESIITWLSDHELHPLIQFKALQSLKIRGAAGTVRIPKGGGFFGANIAETPLNPEQFPQKIAVVMEMLQENNQMNDPEFVSFASQTWHEFLAFQYGTATYQQLANQEARAAAAWAAALHKMVLEMLHGAVDHEDIYSMYNITEELNFIFEQACRSLQNFREMVYRFIHC